MDHNFNHLPLVPNYLTQVGSSQILGRLAFKSEIQVYNFTTRNICVRHRNGITYMLTPDIPNSPEHRGKFVVRHIMQTTAGVVKYMAHIFNDAPDQLSNAAKKLIDAHHSATTRFTDSVVSAHYECVFDSSRLDPLMNYYIADSDITISFQGIYEMAPHPFCKNAIDLINERRALIDKLDLMSILVVDNTGSRESVFMPYAGMAYEIPVIRDLDLVSGIHIHHIQRCYGLNGELIPLKQYISFEEMGNEYYQFYSSKSACFERLRVNDNSDLEIARHKRETEEIKSAVERYKAELGMLETKLRHSETQHKAAASAADALRSFYEEQQKMLREEIKRNYENRASLRKELVDIIKTIPPIIALFQLIHKLKTSGS